MSMDSSLGILDLDNLSTFTECRNTTSFVDRISLISEKTKQKVSLLYQSQSQPQPVFKVPDTSTTSALLSKRMFPQAFQSSAKHSVSDDIPVKELSSLNVSQGSLDSRYFRECSDSEWRFTGTMDESNNQLQASSKSNKVEPDPLTSFSRNNFENIFSKSKTYESRKDSVITEGLPTPFKGSQSIIGMNNSAVTSTSLTLDFRNDQISARSSSLSGSGTDTGSSRSNCNPSIALKLSKLGSTVLAETSTQPFGKTMIPKNPFDESGCHVEPNASWMPPDNIRLSFPNSFNNEFQAFQLGNEDFLSGGDAMKLIDEGEVSFLKEKELELPDELPLGDEAPSFGTYRNTSTVSRPSFVNSILSNGEVPDRVTKDILFRAKSDRLGALGQKSNALRPYFGLDVKSPARNDLTNASRASEYNIKSSNNCDISEFIKDLSITIPDNEQTLLESMSKTKQNGNLSRISEVFDSPSLSVPSYQSNEGTIKVTRSHSANEVDFSSNVDIRKCHSTGDLLPEKKHQFVFQDHYGSFHSLPKNTNSFSQNGGHSFGFCPSHHSPSLLQANSHINGPVPCLQCYENAARMHNIPTTQIQYPHPSPLTNYPYQVPLTPTSYSNFYYPEQNMPQNEIILGPSELSAGYVCWGSNSKINIPLINPSNRVLSCGFTIITVFMGSQKIKPEKLGIILPGSCDIPPRATKESTVNLSALEEGIFNLWIEITTTVPCLHTSLGSFICHVTLTVEYPKLVVEIPFGKHDNTIDFDFALRQDEDNKTMFVKIMSQSKAVTPVIIFLQTEQSEDFQYIFPERKMREIMMKSSHVCQILSSTILLFQIKGETNKDNSVLIPITIVIRNKYNLESISSCILKGSVTVGLQCPNKEDQDLEKISLRGKIRHSRSLSTSNIRSTEATRTKPNSYRKSAHLVKPTSTKGIDSDAAVSHLNEGFNNNHREIAERDETISKLDTSSFMESKWDVEPMKLNFRRQNQELEFCISSSILLWMQISYPKDVFQVNPDQGICKPNSKVVVRVKLLTRTKSWNVEEIKITCDGLEKVLKVMVRDLPDFSPPS